MNGQIEVLVPDSGQKGWGKVVGYRGSQCFGGWASCPWHRWGQEVVAQG